MFSHGKTSLIVILLAAVLAMLWSKPALAPQRAAQNGELPLNEPKNETRLLFVGDIMLSRNVGAKIDKASDPNLPFLNLRSLISSADIAMGNLECPLTSGYTPVLTGSLIFRCSGTFVPGLVNAGFDVLSTANNHSMDQGMDDLEFTTEELLKNNILPVGTNTFEPRVIEKNAINFGFLAYSYSAFNDGKFSAHPKIATMGDLDKLRQDIWQLRGHYSDGVIVSMHAGTEYTREPNQMQKDFARAAIDAGAEAVIGHHPHWIQTIEIYKGRPIFYSLGNFVFDQMWSQDTREGLVVELIYHDLALQSAKLIPVIIDDYCCPRLATDEEKMAILKKINLETDVIEFDKTRQ